MRSSTSTARRRRRPTQPQSARRRRPAGASQAAAALARWPPAPPRLQQEQRGAAGARARPGRGEPWHLFPPRPGEYPPDIKENQQKFSEAINADFPPFIQSLLDDLDGAVIRL